MADVVDFEVSFSPGSTELDGSSLAALRRRIDKLVQEDLCIISALILQGSASAGEGTSEQGVRVAASRERYLRAELVAKGISAQRVFLTADVGLKGIVAERSSVALEVVGYKEAPACDVRRDGR